MPTQQSHTFASHTSHHTDQSLQKSVPAPPEKKFIFFLPSLLCFNFFSTHTRHDKTAKLTTDKDNETRWTERQLVTAPLRYGGGSGNINSCATNKLWWVKTV